MKKDEAEEYTQALGQVVAGGWRHIALGQRLGVPEALGLSVEDWVQKRLGGYVRYSVQERQTIVKELAKDGMSQRHIAEVLGVGVGTVNRDVPNGTRTKDKTNENGSRDVPNGTPLDILAGLAADDSLRQEAEKLEINKERARARENVRAKPFSPIGKYLVYADPPWQYDFSPTENRKIENQYPTATVEEICAHINTDALNPDCVLFMWATAPKLREALTVMDAWKFQYKTHAVWDKEMIGMGYWFRGEHELLLVGTRGNPQPPPQALRVGSVFRFRRTEHSVKPPDVKRIIASLFPEIQKEHRAEMYQRQNDPDWPAWP